MIGFVGHFQPAVICEKRPIRLKRQREKYDLRVIISHSFHIYLFKVP
jgi:hypothetical protein